MSPNIRRPRHGSMQYWPRKRAKRICARVRSWAPSKENQLLGFVGYKAGMTHIMAKDNTTNSNTKGMVISMPVTVIECPSLKPFSMRFYQKDINNQLRIVSEVFAKNLNKELKRKVELPKKQNKIPERFDELRISLYTQPKLIGIKKKPDMIEIGLSGAKEQKLELAKKLLEQPEVKLKDVFKENQMLDVAGITKGKGFQGVIKRYGVKILVHKSEQKRRSIASQGPWTPKKVSYRVARPGKMGFHQRTELNKQVLKILEDPKDVNPKGGFLHYGIIKNPCLLLKGSVPGPAKRPIVLSHPRRPYSSLHNLEISKISTASKQ
jgi:large subunit ribosomal protein L3